MFTLLSNLSLKNNFKKDAFRYFCWIKKKDPYKFIGIENDILLSKKIYEIKYPSQNPVLKGEKLFDLVSNNLTYKTFYSKEDCIIVDRKIYNFKTINENNWIIKIRTMDRDNDYIIFNKQTPKASNIEKKLAIKKIYNSTKYTPYTYYSNYSEKSINLNKNKLICNILSNH